MHALAWIPPNAAYLLDVGCNDGALLADCRKHYPSMVLCGIDVNADALTTAKKMLPDARLHCVRDVNIPFEDSLFDCVTCIEVIEHIPASSRAKLISEIKRVLKPGALLILRCPHAGTFEFLDSNNMRFRLPKLYRAVVGKGLRDDGYLNGAADVCWHQHFTLAELDQIMDPALCPVHLRYGGFLVFPIVDILRWPFYRLRRYNSRLLRLLDRIAAWDLGINYGTFSFDVLRIFAKTAD